MTLQGSYAAGFQAALNLIQAYDTERVRIGHALTDAEIRRLADFMLNPLRLVSTAFPEPS